MRSGADFKKEIEIQILNFLLKLYCSSNQVLCTQFPCTRGHKTKEKSRQFIFLFNCQHIKWSSTQFQDLPLSLITPRRVGSRRWLERQHKHPLNLANTTGLSWDCWPHTGKLKPLLNKLIGKMRLQKVSTLSESKLSRSERRTSATWSPVALKGQREAKTHHALVCRTNAHPPPWGNMLDSALGWTDGQWVMPSKPPSALPRASPRMSGARIFFWLAWTRHVAS